jgi:S-formylglutathione hydrolase FrmB
MLRSLARAVLLGAALSSSAFLLAAPAAAEIRQGRFDSAALGRAVTYTVDLPASYAGGAGRYPVLYALHGLFESDAFWERRGLATALQRLRDAHQVPDFVVVAVDGGNSFFVNGRGGRFEDMVTKDLIAHVEETYRVIRGREGRALFGVSMGGYAALRIALLQPGLFAAAATHSAMLLERPPTAEQGARSGQMAAFHAAFGDPIDPALWAGADPLSLVAKADPKATPALYLDCGSEDRYGLAAGHRELDRRLTDRGVAHEFALHPGDHGYAYILSVIDRSLTFAGRALAGKGAGDPGAGKAAGEKAGGDKTAGKGKP